jgi:hypothetical protein
MIRNQFAASTAIATGLILLIAAPGPARGAGFSPSGLQVPATATPASRAAAATGDDDFAGLDLTDEQKTEIAKIHQRAEAAKAVVAKDIKLTSDQKDAFLLGYTRQEYGEMFRVLTPLQQKLVRKKMEARRAADQASHAKQPPPRAQR